MFRNDRQGKRFSDIVNDAGVPFDAVFSILDDPAARRRMIEAESIHGRPALAGIVKDLERLPVVDAYFRSRDAHETVRFRQAVGVAVRVVMEDMGWRTTGRKGSLGVRAKVAAGATTPGASINEAGGLSRWFTRAEHYRAEPPGADDPTVPAATGRPRPTADDFRRALVGLEQIGTPEEREETLRLLMKGLAETDRAEGRGP